MSQHQFYTKSERAPGIFVFKPIEDILNIQDDFSTVDEITTTYPYVSYDNYNYAVYDGLHDQYYIDESVKHLTKSKAKRLVASSILGRITYYYTILPDHIINAAIDKTLHIWKREGDMSIQWDGQHYTKTRTLIRVGDNLKGMTELQILNMLADYLIEIFNQHNQHVTAKFTCLRSTKVEKIEDLKYLIKLYRTMGVTVDLFKKYCAKPSQTFYLNGCTEYADNQELMLQFFKQVLKEKK